MLLLRALFGPPLCPSAAQPQGWDVLLRAFLSAFSAQDNVLLLLHTQPFHSSSNFAEQMQASWRAHFACLQSSCSCSSNACTSLPQLPHLLPARRLQAWAQRELGHTPQDAGRLPSVYVLGEHIAAKHFPRLYKSADAFVLPTRCAAACRRPAAHVSCTSPLMPALLPALQGRGLGPAHC